MHIAILGRQPALGIAELERVFGGKSITPLSDTAVQIDCDGLDIQRFGGMIKAGVVVSNLQTTDWRRISDAVITHFASDWRKYSGKITLGISAYGFNINPRDIQKIGIIIKQKLKNSTASLRLIPSTDTALSSATSHHNKLGLSANKVEIIIIKTDNNQTIIATSTGSQNITAYAGRDQARPMRDAFVGMLPPKLAQIMINLAVGQVVDGKWYMVNGRNTVSSSNEVVDGKWYMVNGRKQISEDNAAENSSTEINPQPLPNTIYHLPFTILDPFCGTGVILQEAALLGYSVYGTDLSEKMVRYSRDNLNWLADTHHITFDWLLNTGDAMDTKWRQPINAVVCETYLGQPFSAPPSPAKLNEVVENCNHIITEFLRNLRDQIEPGTPICIAIPAWRDKSGNFTHLPIISTIARYGYKPHEFMNVSQNDLLYYRADQVVARELLVLTRQ